MTSRIPFPSVGLGTPRGPGLDHAGEIGEPTYLRATFSFTMDAERLFKVPAYPLEEVFDPTGAGDAFAGGFMGHLARTDDLSPANLRRAIVYGAAMGSFAVEEFGIRRFDSVTLGEVRARVLGFRDLVQFDHGLEEKL